MTVATISEFRANLKRYVDDVINNSGSLLINRGSTAAVLISLDEYNSIKETEKVLSSEKLSGRLESGIEELNSGKAVAVDVDEL